MAEVLYYILHLLSGTTPLLLPIVLISTVRSLSLVRQGVRIVRHNQQGCRPLGDR